MPHVYIPTFLREIIAAHKAHKETQRDLVISILVDQLIGIICPLSRRPASLQSATCKPATSNCFVPFVPFWEIKLMRGKIIVIAYHRLQEIIRIVNLVNRQYRFQLFGNMPQRGIVAGFPGVLQRGFNNGYIAVAKP